MTRFPKKKDGTPNIGIVVPAWVWTLHDGTYKPSMEWDMLLQGYERWHETGATFPEGKGQSPDYKNWGVTLPSVAMALRRYDEANCGGVVPREREPYWNAVTLASAAVMARMRARRAATEAQTAAEFGLPDAAAKREKAIRAIRKAAKAICPRFYVRNLGELPVIE